MWNKNSHLFFCQKLDIFFDYFSSHVQRSVLVVFFRGILYKMFKPRRTAIRRCKENRIFSGRSGDRQFNLEGNSNITSNRVTIPPGFLCLGVKSETVRRSPLKENFISNTDFVFSEGFYNNNLNENGKRPRRSTRLSRKTEDTFNYENLSAFEYYCKNFDNQTHIKQQKSLHESNSILKNNSKSVFKEINERYAKAQAQNFNYPIAAVISPQTKVEYFCPSVFCLNLSREVCVDLGRNDYLVTAKLAVAQKIRDINRRICGKMDSESTPPKKYEQMEPHGEQQDFNYIPKYDWIFETPPRQPVVLPRTEDCIIQPAVICTAKKQSNIYELNPNVKVDLTGFCNRQNMPVDRRYMRLASFEEERGPGFGFGADRYRGLDQVNLEDGGCSFFEDRNAVKQIRYTGSSSTISKIFAQATCRPSKTIKKVSRTKKFYSRKSEEAPDGTPTGSNNLFQSLEDYERDFTFVEDGGQFKIVSTQTSKNDDRFEFKFRKNLFKETEEKVFNFEEPKMFNFENLKDN